MGKEWTETPWGSWKWQDLGLCLRNLHQHTKIFSKAIGNLAGSDTNGDVLIFGFFFSIESDFFIPGWWFHHWCLGTSIMLCYYVYLPVVPHRAVAEVSKIGKPIGELGCCEPEMAERIHWWTERCLRYPLFSLFLWLSTYLPAYLLCIYLSISLSLFHPITYLPIYLATYLPIYLSTYVPIYLSIYLSISLSLSFICLSV